SIESLLADDAALIEARGGRQLYALRSRPPPRATQLCQTTPDTSTDVPCSFASGDVARFSSARGAGRVPLMLTTNGAGPRNVQLFMFNSDGTVLHCLPGFWTPGDLLYELQFAQSLNRLWTDAFMSREAKDKRFRELNLKHAQAHTLDMRNRSR